MSMYDIVKGALGFGGSSVKASLNIPDFFVAGALFIGIMYVANMFFAGEKNKLFSVAILVLVFLYVFFFL